MLNINPLKENIESNPKFFYILGAFKGDGYYNVKYGKVQIGVIDFDFLENIKSIFNELSPQTRVKIVNHCKAKNNSQEQKRINLCCKEFFKRKYHLLEPKTQLEKIEYLKGLFDAEGSITYGYDYDRNNNLAFKRCISLAQKNINDLIKWKNWLNELNIKSRLILREDGRSHIYIKRTNDIKRFAKIINFHIKRKRIKLDFTLTKITKSITPQHKINQIIKLYKSGLSSNKLTKIFNLNKASILCILRKNNIPRRSRLWKDKKIITSKIISIKSIGQQKGFDLVTPKYNNFFLSNKILSHNSTAVYKIVKRLKCLKQKFNPRRDLLYKRDDVIRALSTYQRGVIVGDELINVAYGRDFYEENQKKLLKGLNMYRDSENVFIGCVPRFSDLDIQIQRLCKLRLTVVRRGIALIQRPLSSIYTKDPWDMKNNMKIESNWIGKKKKPQYSKLTTVVGYMTFTDLNDKQKKMYQDIKKEKRNKVYMEDDEIDILKNPKTIFLNYLWNEIKQLNDRGTPMTPNDLKRKCNNFGMKYHNVRSKLLNRVNNDYPDLTLKDFVKGSDYEGKKTKSFTLIKQPIVNKEKPFHPKPLV